MRIIDIEQRTPDWHIWRNLGVSASDASVILGLSTELDLADDEDTIALLHDSVSPYKTPWRLWAEKTGLVVPEDLSRNPHVQRGVALEGAAIADFEERHATLLLPLCGESEACREIRASFDGVDPDGTPVEIKVPCSRRYLEVLSLGTSSDLYRLYWPQVQTQLYVAGADKGWLVFYQGPGVHHEFEITRDDQFIDGQLVPAMRAFWTKVQSNEAPAMDPARDLFIPEGDALGVWTTLAGEFRKLANEHHALEQEAKAKKARLNAIRDELAGLMGEFMLAETAGVRVSRFAMAGSVDWKQIVRDHLPDLDAAEIEAYRKPGAMTARVTVQSENKAAVPFDGETLEQSRRQAVDQVSGWF